MIELSIILGAIRLLNVAIRGIKEISETSTSYKNYGKTLRGFVDNVEIVHSLLRLWEDDWEIGKSGQGGEGLRYFGEDGWKLIKKEVALIDETSLTLVGLLAPLLPLDSGDEPTPKSSGVVAGTTALSNGSRTPNKLKKRNVPAQIKLGREFMKALSQKRLKALEEAKSNATEFQEGSSFFTKIISVLQGDEAEISMNIEKLRAQYYQLDHMSGKYFERKYSFDCAASENMAPEQRRGLVQKHWDSNYALRFREKAISMIDVLPEEVGLELDTSRNPSASLDTVEYKLITEPSIGDHDGSYELSVQAFGPHPEEAASFPTFISAYRKAQTQEGLSVLLRVQSNENPQIFYKYSFTATRLTDETPQKLAAKFAAQEKNFRFRERLELSYRLADSCLLLLNTSWMSFLSSENVIVRKDADAVRYCLGFRQNSGGNAQLVSQLSDTQKREAYSFGILLIELATQKKVSAFNGSVEPPKFDLGTGEIDLGTVISKVHHEMGPEFSKVVQACFSDILTSPDDDWDKERRLDFELEMLHEFHEKVLKPLKDKARGAHKVQYAATRTTLAI